MMAIYRHARTARLDRRYDYRDDLQSAPGGSGRVLRERHSPEDGRRLFAENFSPEFVNRIDALCIFQPLEKHHLRQIIETRFLPALQQVYRRRGLELMVEESALEWLAARGFHEHYGARELERAVERDLLLLLAPHVPFAIDSVEQPPRTARITVQEGQLSVEIS